jgi:hypothetical protein
MKTPISGDRTAEFLTSTDRRKSLAQSSGSVIYYRMAFQPYHNWGNIQPFLTIREPTGLE